MQVHVQEGCVLSTEEIKALEEQAIKKDYIDALFFLRDNSRYPYATCFAWVRWLAERHPSSLLGITRY